MQTVHRRAVLSGSESCDLPFMRGENPGGQAGEKADSLGSFGNLRGRRGAGRLHPLRDSPGDGFSNRHCGAGRRMDGRQGDSRRRLRNRRPAAADPGSRADILCDQHQLHPGAGFHWNEKRVHTSGRAGQESVCAAGCGAGGESYEGASPGKAAAGLLVLATISPFLELASSPVGGLISLFIIFIGLQRAWAMTAGHEILVTGPYS